MGQSLKNNYVGITLMTLSAILVSVGQLLWKIGTIEGILIIAFGFVIYGLGAFILTLAFRFGEISFLHPFLSLNYVFALFLGHYFLSEIVTYRQFLGVIVIMFGITLIGMSSNE